MIPPTSIDGTDISGATIDGQDVEEITVDGDVVFSAGPPPGTIDDFEDGNLNEYSGSIGIVQSSEVLFGSFAFEQTGNGNMISTSGLPNYPQSGNTINLYFKEDSPSDTGGLAFLFGVQNTSQFYAVNALAQYNFIGIFKDGVGGGSQISPNGSATFGTDWIEFEIVWNSPNIDFTVFSVNQTTGARTGTLGTVSATDSTYTSGGIGFGANSYAGSGYGYFDKITKS